MVHLVNPSDLEQYKARREHLKAGNEERDMQSLSKGIDRLNDLMESMFERSESKDIPKSSFISDTRNELSKLKEFEESPMINLMKKLISTGERTNDLLEEMLHKSPLEGKMAPPSKNGLVHAARRMVHEEARMDGTAPPTRMPEDHLIPSRKSSACVSFHKELQARLIHDNMLNVGWKNLSRLKSAGGLKEMFGQGNLTWKKSLLFRIKKGGEYLVMDYNQAVHTGYIRIKPRSNQ